jgi:glycosyltransferase involved in cell wall biosynthesis
MNQRGTLASALDLIAKDLQFRKKASSESLKRATEIFSAEVIVPKFVELYRKILSGEV